MHALLQCWFEFGLCLFFYFILFFKKNCNLKNVIFFFVFALTTTIISADVISETAELRRFMLVCFLYLFFFSFGFFLNFSWGQLVLQDLEQCIRRRVVTISDLKEVLRAKTAEMDRLKASEERSYQGESYYSWEYTVKQPTQKKLQQNSARDLISFPV